MATEIHLLTENGDSGTYWAGLPTIDPGGGGNYRDRYYHRSAYQVWSSIHDFYVWVNGNPDRSRVLILEIQGKWDSSTTNSTALSGFFSLLITTKVNGVRDPDSWHNGVFGGGFRIVCTNKYRDCLALGYANIVVDGVEFAHSATDGGEAISGGSINGVVKNCLLTGYNGFSTNSGVSGLHFHNNIVKALVSGSGSGITIGSGGYGSGAMFYNNLVTGFDVGFNATVTQYNSNAASFLNNISINNTTNWSSDPTHGPPTTYDTCFCSGNVGESGDTPWTTSGQSSFAVATTDFEDFANDDYEPTASSPVLGQSIEFPGMTDEDLLGDVIPSYNPDGEQARDCGPVERDQGHGLAPDPSSLILTANVSLVGAEIRIYDNDGAVGDYGTELDGVESCTTGTYIYNGLLNNNIIVQVMLADYQEFVLELTLDSESVTLPINLERFD